MSDYASYTDQELVVRLHAGDRQAYTQIYHRYKYVLQSHAYQKLGDFEEVQDILQDVFTTLWLRRAEVRADANLPGYLYRAVRNRVLNSIAHSQVVAKHLDSLQQYIDAGHEVTDQQLREREFAVEIDQEIDALPAKMREIFVLSRKSELSHKEIAERLKLSEQTVAKQVSNALKILRQRLGHLLGLLLTAAVILLIKHIFYF